MTKIKIHDAEWFDKCCCPGKGFHDVLRPKGLRWRRYAGTHGIVYWLSEGPMNDLVGKVLEVEKVAEDVTANEMRSAKYMAEGFYIPNWAIEWVMEE